MAARKIAVTKKKNDKVRCRQFFPADKKDIAVFLEKIGVHKWAVDYLGSKGTNAYLLLENVDNRAANILKQEMLSLGRDAAVDQDVCRFKKGRTSVILFLNLADIEKLKTKLKKQPFGLEKLGEDISACLKKSSSSALQIGKKIFDLKKQTVILGILNITPDSFYDGGRFFSPDKAGVRARALVSAGADAIDVGGESTRPGARAVGVAEELARVLPAVKAIRAASSIPISVDTYKAGVAMKCLEAGASMINDVSALRSDKEMARVIRDFDCAVVLMHMKGSPGTMQRAPFYKDCIGEIYSFFEERIEFAVRNGIDSKRIILDPGIGFGKRLEDNLEILKRFGEFGSLGFPLLAGSSRKSFIGMITGNGKDKGCDPPESRLEGTIASCLWAVANGAGILRVHDVEAVKKAIKVFTAIRDQKIS